MNSKRKHVVLAAALCLTVGMISHWAMAGAVYGESVVFADLGGGVHSTSGTLGQVQNSTSQYEWIGCTVSSTPAGRSGYCEAVLSNGSQVVPCFTEDPNLIDVMLSLHGGSHVRWTSAYQALPNNPSQTRMTCLSLDISTSSTHPRKRYPL